MDPLTIALLSVGVQFLDILLKRRAKNPAEAPALAPLASEILSIMSRAAEESSEETASRLAAHDSLVAQYGAAPPPGLLRKEE